MGPEPGEAAYKVYWWFCPQGMPQRQPCGEWLPYIFPSKVRGSYLPTIASFPHGAANGVGRTFGCFCRKECLMKYMMAIFLACMLWGGQVLAASGPSKFMRGDANGDGFIDISDAVRVLITLFRSPELSSCDDAMDANDDGQLDVSDAVTVLVYLFRDGKASPAPLMECGDDPTEDALGCQEHEQCPLPPTPYLIRNASGWPDTSLTAERPGMESSREYPLGFSWGVTGVWLVVSEPTVITGAGGIGLSDENTSPAANFRPRLNVHSTSDVFALDALHGDVRQEVLVQQSEDPILVSKDGPNFTWVYYVSFMFEPFELDPGVYLLSIYAERTGASWWWCESSRDLGSDITTDSTNVGQWFAFDSHPDFTTGTAALDVFGYAVSR